MITLHIVADNADPKRIDRAIQYLKVTHQPTVNIAGGSQVDLAMQLVERVIAEVPAIIPFFRILEDTGIIMQMGADELYKSRVQPRLAWMQKNKVVYVVDNETSGSDAIIQEYVRREVAFAKHLHADGLHGAFLRFATGNIGDGTNGNTNQYPLLKPMLDELQLGDFVSPNEYSNAPGKSSGGHLERYKRIEAIAGHPLPIAIGEAGILVDYKANAGFDSIHLPGKTYAAQLIGEEIWYRGGSIPRHVFCVGGYGRWASMQLPDDFYEFLEGYYASNPISYVPQIPVTVAPPAKPPAPPVQPAPIDITTPAPPIPPAPVQVDEMVILKSVLVNIRDYGETIGRIAVQLGGLRDDISAEGDILEALIKRKELENVK